MKRCIRIKNKNYYVLETPGEHILEKQENYIYTVLLLNIYKVSKEKSFRLWELFRWHFFWDTLYTY